MRAGSPDGATTSEVSRRPAVRVLGGSAVFTALAISGIWWVRSFPAVCSVAGGSSCADADRTRAAALTTVILSAVFVTLIACMVARRWRIGWPVTTCVAGLVVAGLVGLVATLTSTGFVVPAFLVPG